MINALKYILKFIFYNTLKYNNCFVLHFTLPSNLNKIDVDLYLAHIKRFVKISY